MCAIILAAIPFIASIGGKTAFWGEFALLIVFGAFSGLQQGAVFALAAAFPFKYMGAVMFGNGISGIATNGIRVLSYFIWDPSDPDPKTADWNAYIGTVFFFALASAFQIVCVCCQFIFRKN